MGALLCLGIPNWEEDPRRRGRAEGHSTALPCVLTLKEEGLGAITYSSSVGIFSCGTPYHTRDGTMQTLAKSKAALHFLPQCFYLLASCICVCKSLLKPECQIRKKGSYLQVYVSEKSIF